MRGIENALCDKGMPDEKIVNVKCQHMMPIINLLLGALLGLLLGSVPGNGRKIGTESDGELLRGFSWSML